MKNVGVLDESASTGRERRAGFPTRFLKGKADRNVRSPLGGSFFNPVKSVLKRAPSSQTRYP
jgi:hypothetical protein